MKTVKNIKELWKTKIGDIVELGNKKFLVINSDEIENFLKKNCGLCSVCVFMGVDTVGCAPCVAPERRDKKNVVFLEIKK